ncbi:MAG: hypothetical protein EOO77_33265 [Oxalobacteraceae bacterium]|nr:MAG: hypothetical protein EOO77_33265 [Oxalobacteraceae bacterium]
MKYTHQPVVEMYEVEEWQFTESDERSDHRTRWMSIAVWCWEKAPQVSPPRYARSPSLWQGEGWVIDYFAGRYRASIYEKNLAMEFRLRWC